MDALAVKIPEEILITAKIPCNKWENEIKKEISSPHPRPQLQFQPLNANSPFL